ncbi:hypothetical protein B0H14DRAFT_2603993 [Mycena olivaceomarginata]|nr:hypothetical protein B0H14DRAFT_2603993 [Mycena olivaceomarginata]
MTLNAAASLASATNASEAEGRSELDIAMDEPWYLSPDGALPDWLAPPATNASEAEGRLDTAVDGTWLLASDGALDAPNWLAPPATNASEAEGRSDLDVAMDGPWFLAPDGILSRDWRSDTKCKSTHSSRAHDEAELLPAETHPGSDAADFFVQSASTFAMILKYLPNVPRLNGNYRRRTDGTWRQIKDLYFVVEKHDFPLADGWQAARVYLAAMDPWLTIQVALSREEAEKLIEKQNKLHHRA